MQALPERCPRCGQELSQYKTQKLEISTCRESHYDYFYAIELNTISETYGGRSLYVFISRHVDGGFIMAETYSNSEKFQSFKEEPSKEKIERILRLGVVA